MLSCSHSLVVALYSVHDATSTLSKPWYSKHKSICLPTGVVTGLAISSSTNEQRFILYKVSSRDTSTLLQANVVAVTVVIMLSTGSSTT